MTTTLLKTALTAHRAGLCVLPPKEDGSKRPDAARWVTYQGRTSTEDEIERWYSGGRTGLGLVCGTVSGNLELLEFEGRAVTEGLWKEFKAAAKEVGLEPLLSRVMRGFGERSPSGGIHLIYRCKGAVEGNTELARRPATPEELADNPTEKIKVLIETRGEGGYVVVAPSNGNVHPTGGRYEMLSGGFDSIATISPEEREALLELARSFDRTPTEEWKPPAGGPKEETAGLQPGDDFNARADWAAHVLEPAGWSFTGRRSGRDHWYRARDGQRGWTSATISPDGQYLYAFSTSTDLPTRKGLSKFRVYAFLHHDGDFRAAARALVEKGYGERDRGGEIRHGDTTKAAAEPEIIKVEEQGPWPDPPATDAFYGLASRIVDLIDPYAEADSAAVLIQFLVAYGVAVGLRPHFMVGATRHSPALYMAIVGKTSRGRKGTGWDPVESLLKGADPSFGERIVDGLGSGEKLVHLVRDERRDENNRIVAAGVADKRVLLQEGELARILVAVNREGSTLSSYLRTAYDGRPLRNLVKGDPAESTSHHIGLIGHTSPTELRSRLTEDSINNGLANRVGYFLSRRSKKIAEPEVFEGSNVDDLIDDVRQHLRQASTITRMERSPEARALWKEWYESLPDDEPGTVGALTARAEAHVLRYSMVYALTDASGAIEVDHLKAALALWAYSERCIGYIFGGTTGNPVADAILKDLEFGPMITREIMAETFHGHISARDLHAALDLLKSQGRVKHDRLKTGGRPADRWRKA